MEVVLPTKTTDNLIQALIVPNNKGLSLREAALALTKSGKPETAKIIKHGTQISTLINSRGEEGKQFVVSLVAILINNFHNSFNVIRGMTEDQQADLAFDWVEEFWFLKLEDFVAFLALAKKLKYGKVLDRMDSSILNDWIAKYIFERSEDVRRLSYNYDYEEPREPRPEDAVNRTLATVSTIKDFAKTADFLRNKANPSK